MPDIQMCAAVDAEGRVCLIAHECHRHMAAPSEWQAYGPPGPQFDPKDGCDYYLPLSKMGR